MAPVFALAVGLMGAAAFARWCAKEVHRVNAKLDNFRGDPTIDPIDRESLPTLKRDPRTGEYRPG